MAGITNTGVVDYISNPIASFPKNSITVDIFGNAFYRSYSFGAGDDTGVYWSEKDDYSQESMLFFTIAMKKSLLGKFDYSFKLRSSQSLNFTMKLPVKDGKPDFDFMDSFITALEAERMAKLDAYLLVTGLKDYILTDEEQQALDDFEQDKVVFSDFIYKSIFDNIVQGRRLKKDDQLAGDIPFVMAGTTNMGVVNYISNPIASFPKNSITIDIFGNVFYRNYSFGAGDDTGVYWNSQKTYPEQIMLFCATSIQKSLANKFDYGNKLRSSKSFDFKMKLPIKDKQPDYAIMETLISAIKKLVIKDVVLYVTDKIQTQTPLNESTNSLEVSEL